MEENNEIRRPEGHDSIPNQPEMPLIPDISTIPPLPVFEEEKPASIPINSEQTQFIPPQNQPVNQNQYGFNPGAGTGNTQNIPPQPNYTHQQQQYTGGAYTQYPMQVNVPNSGGILSLGIISILSLCCCGFIIAPILSTIALIMTSKAKKAYFANPSMYKPSSFKNMKAGQICAIIGLSLAGFLLLVFILNGLFNNGFTEFNEAINEAWNETGY